MTEQKQAAEDRADRLDADLDKQKADNATLIKSFDAKKEEHRREELKVKNLEITDQKQKEQLGNKDQQIKVEKEKYQALNEEQNKLNDHHKKLQEDYNNTSGNLRNVQSELANLIMDREKLRREKEHQFNKGKEIEEHLDTTK